MADVKLSAEERAQVEAALEAERAKLASLEAELSELSATEAAAKEEYAKVERRISAAGQSGRHGELAQRQRQFRLVGDRVRGARAKVAACRAAIGRLDERLAADTKARAEPVVRGAVKKALGLFKRGGDAKPPVKGNKKSAKGDKRPAK
jgi:septal ring factor EnvC (AmiA/AmiB activator)